MKKFIATAVSALSLSLCAANKLPENVLVHVTTASVENLLTQVDKFSSEVVAGTPYALYVQPGMMKNMLPIATGLSASVLDLKRSAHLFLDAEGSAGLFLPIVDSSKIKEQAGAKALSKSVFKLLTGQHIALCKENYIVYAENESSALKMAKAFNNCRAQTTKQQLSATVDVPQFYKLVDTNLNEMMKDLDKEARVNPEASTHLAMIKELIGKSFALVDDIESATLNLDLKREHARFTGSLEFSESSRLASIVNLAQNDKIDYSLSRHFDLSGPFNIAICNNEEVMKAMGKLIVSLFEGSEDTLGVVKLLNDLLNSSAFNSGTSFMDLTIAHDMKPSYEAISEVQKPEAFIKAQAAAMKAQASFTTNLYQTMKLPIQLNATFKPKAGTVDGLPYALSKVSFEADEENAAMLALFKQQEQPPVAFVKLSSNHVGFVSGSNYEDQLKKLITDYKAGKSNNEKFIKQTKKLVHNRNIAATISPVRLIKAALTGQIGKAMMLPAALTAQIDAVKGNETILVGVDTSENKITEEVVISSAAIKEGIEAIMKIQMMMMQEQMK